MDFYREHLLSVITYTPLVGALVLLLPAFGGKEKENAVRWVANGVRPPRLPGEPAALVLVRPRGGRLPVRREGATGSPRSASSTSSASTGSRALLILLTTLLGSIAILSSWTAITDRVRAVLRLPAAPAGRDARRLLRPRHVPLLRVLGGHAGPDVLPDRDLGRRAAALRGDQVLPVHARRLGGDAARHPRPLLPREDAPGLRGDGHLRLHACGCRWGSRRTCSSGSSSPSSSASRSRCRCSRSTPGCPTPTSRRRPRAP